MSITTPEHGEFTTHTSPSITRCECRGECGLDHTKDPFDDSTRCYVRHQPHSSAGTVKILLTTRTPAGDRKFCYSCGASARLTTIPTVRDGVGAHHVTTGGPR